MLRFWQFIFLSYLLGIVEQRLVHAWLSAHKLKLNPIEGALPELPKVLAISDRMWRTAWSWGKSIMNIQSQFPGTYTGHMHIWAEIGGMRKEVHHVLFLKSGLIAACTLIINSWNLPQTSMNTVHVVFMDCTRHLPLLWHLVELGDNWVTVVDCSPWQVVTKHVWSPSQVCAISLTASPGLPWNKTLNCLCDCVYVCVCV